MKYFLPIRRQKTKVGAAISALPNVLRRRPPRTGMIFILALGCVVLGACSTGRSPGQGLGGLFGAQSTAQPSAARSAPATSAESAQPTTYYAGVEGLKVYSEPRASASLLTQLPLYQKVYRYKIEQGYAYVQVEGANLTGWVDNARLIWRLPRTPTAAPSATEERASEPTTVESLPVSPEPPPSPPPAAVEPVVKQATEPPSPTPLETPPSSPLPQAQAPAAPARTKPPTSIFDPF